LVMVDLFVIARSVATKQSQKIVIVRHKIASPSARNDIINLNRIVHKKLTDNSMKEDNESKDS